MTAPLRQEQEATTATTPPIPVAASSVPARFGRRTIGLLLAPLGWIAAALAVIARRPVRALIVLVLLALIGTSVWLTGQRLWVQYHLRAARDAVAHFHNLDATTHLEVCLSQWPDHPESLLLAARTARRLKAFSDAERYLDRYLQTCGEDDDLNLERVLLKAEQGEVDSVMLFCRALVAQEHPATSLVLEALAAGLAHAYRLGEAEEILGFWLQREPDNTLALLYQGHLLELQQRPSDAVVSYRRAVEIDPEFDEARQRLAAALIDLQQAGEAQPHLEHLRKRRPHNPAVLFELARCRAQLGEAEEALALLNDVLDAMPEYIPALEERALIAMRTGQTQNAEHWLRELTQLAPGSYQSHHQLYLCLKQNGKTDEAQAVQKRAKEVEADSRRYTDIIRGHMQRTPHDAGLHYELGMILMRMGSPREGLRWLESALREDPRHAPTHRSLALYYQKAGQTGRAARHLEQAAAAEKEAKAAPAKR
jgi:tetratricopeptide (TPR) repeat protein